MKYCVGVDGALCRQLLPFFCIVIMLSGCSYRSIRYNLDHRLRAAPLCIAMPDNPLVFEDIAPLMYQALWDHFQRVGYRLSTKSSQAFVLQLTLRNLESVDKLISPDIQPYGFRTILTVNCKIFCPDKQLVGERTFTFNKWVYKPAEPRNFRDYLVFFYKQLCETAVVPIDHFTRPLLHR